MDRQICTEGHILASRGLAHLNAMKLDFSTICLEKT